MSMKRVSSKKRFSRSNSLHPDDLESIPKCTGIRYFGDPVEVIRYKPTDYNVELKRLVSLDLKDNPQSIDTVDDDSSNKGIVDKKSLGFDLMSFSSRRGHFVDKVSQDSKAEYAGMKHGDWLLEVNGHQIRDMAHEEVVQLIRQNSENGSELIHFTIVSKDSQSSLMDEENESKIE